MLRQKVESSELFPTDPALMRKCVNLKSSKPLLKPWSELVSQTSEWIPSHTAPLDTGTDIDCLQVAPFSESWLPLLQVPLLSTLHASYFDGELFVSARGELTLAVKEEREVASGVWGGGPHPGCHEVRISFQKLWIVLDYLLWIHIHEKPSQGVLGLGNKDSHDLKWESGTRPMRVERSFPFLLRRLTGCLGITWQTSLSIVISKKGFCFSDKSTEAARGLSKWVEWVT